MKRTPLLLRAAGIVTALAVLTSPAWAQNGSAAQGGQSPRFETGITVPGGIPRAKGPRVYLVSFNTPIGLPGVSLARGVYMFRYVGEGRSAIQVLNAEGTFSYGLFLPNTIRRSGAVNEAAVWLIPPAAAGGPRRVHALFEAGSATGSEFVYQ
jgi:hypothetical protein